MSDLGKILKGVKDNIEFEQSIRYRGKFLINNSLCVESDWLCCDLIFSNFRPILLDHRGIGRDIVKLQVSISGGDCWVDVDLEKIINMFQSEIQKSLCKIGEKLSRDIFCTNQENMSESEGARLDNMIAERSKIVKLLCKKGDIDV